MKEFNLIRISVTKLGMLLVVGLIFPRANGQGVQNKAYSCDFRAVGSIDSENPTLRENKSSDSPKVSYRVYPGKGKLAEHDLLKDFSKDKYLGLTINESEDEGGGKEKFEVSLGIWKKSPDPAGVNLMIAETRFSSEQILNSFTIEVSGPSKELTTSLESNVTMQVSCKR